MWWECSECGGYAEQANAPAICLECGTAGGIFVAADVEDAIYGALGADGLRGVWLNAGLEQARATLDGGERSPP